MQIIKDGYNFCLSRLEEQRLVSLLQGSVESDDSCESGGDGEEGDKAQAPVVRKVDSAIHWINYYPKDNAVGFRNTYPLDIDLSGG